MKLTMKSTLAISLAAWMFLAGGFATASAKSTQAAQSRTLPVLVKVDTKGKVTEVSPAYRVRPSFQRLLRNTISKMITKPAMKKGKAVTSQLVITLAVLTSKDANGNAESTLKYLAAKPLPPGAWSWGHDAQGRLALTSQSPQDNIQIPLTPMEQRANAMNAAAQAQRYQSMNQGSGRP